MTAEGNRWMLVAYIIKNALREGEQGRPASSFGRFSATIIIMLKLLVYLISSGAQIRK